MEFFGRQTATFISISLASIVKEAHEDSLKQTRAETKKQIQPPQIKLKFLLSEFNFSDESLMRIMIILISPLDFHSRRKIAKEISSHDKKKSFGVCLIISFSMT